MNKMGRARLTCSKNIRGDGELSSISVSDWLESSISTSEDERNEKVSPFKWDY